MWGRRAAGLVAASLIVGVAAMPATGQVMPDEGGGRLVRHEPAGDEAGVDEVVCPQGWEAGAGGEAAVKDVGEALLLARVCGREVEASGERGFGQRVVATPAGLLRAELFAVPRWVPDGRGGWQDVDATLVDGGDGVIRSRATVSQVEVSAGGPGPLVTVTDPEGESLSLWWPRPLPQPVLEGDQARFQGVLPDVDLVVVAGVDGFGYRLEVLTPQAAANPALRRVELRVTGERLEVSQDAAGRVEARDGRGRAVFSSGPAMMWDASGEHNDDAGLVGPGVGEAAEQDEGDPAWVDVVPLVLEGDSLVVLPDPDVLTAEDLVFPVVIDPFFTGARQHWANVFDQRPTQGWTDDSAWPRAGGMRVGYCGWPECGSATGVWRSVVRFDMAAVRGKHIVSAAVKMTQTHTGGCGTEYRVQLWEVSNFTSGVSWNGVSWRHGNYLDRKWVPTSNCGEPNRAIVFNNAAVRDRVQANADANVAAISFGVRSNSETARNEWRRISRDSLKLEVEYASYPQTPTSLSTDGKGCATSSPGPWLTTGRPTLSGTPRNADGNGRYRLQVYWGNTMVYEYVSGTITTGVSQSHQIPSASRLWDRPHAWRMRTESVTAGVPASAWSAWCHFQVDTTPPPKPSATQLTVEPEPGQPVQFRLNGSADTTRFRFGLNGGSTSLVNASNGQATITVTPPTSTIDHVLQVWARDAAGNESVRHDQWFVTAKRLPAPVAGVWRFDGDWLDDSGHDHRFVPTPATVLTTNRAGRAQAAARVPAGGCLQSTGGAVLDTSRSFTVAAWVRLASPNNSPDAIQAVVSQAGVARQPFSLEWRRSEDRWNFKMTSSDTWSTTFKHARGTTPSQPGWQHVAGVYDAPAQRMRLYVDGMLEATVEAHPTSWAAPGGLLLGCAGRMDGMTFEVADATVDDVVALQGVLTDGQIRALMQGRVPAGELSWWPLRGSSGADVGQGGNDLEVPGPPAASWVNDRFGRGTSAMRLDGTVWAATDGPVVYTDDSFSVSAWARLDGTDAWVVASQAGQILSGFFLMYHDVLDRWMWIMPSRDGWDQLAFHMAGSQAPPERGRWYHLLGVYDAAAGASGELRLYVDGVLQPGLVPGPAVPWRATGELLVGAGLWTGGEPAVVGQGAVHDLKVWRGAATAEQATAVAVAPRSYWELNDANIEGGGHDAWADAPLAFTGGNFVEDRWGQCAAAWRLDGSAGWAQTPAAVVTTDESFTVSAWARLDSGGTDRVVVSQTATSGPSFQLRYHAGNNRWQFELPDSDTASAAASVAGSLAPPQIGQWQHLVGVYDLGAATVSLYVDGVLQTTVAAPAEPWHQAGRLLVGAAGRNFLLGSRWGYMDGAIAEVRTYAGVLDVLRISQLARIRPVLALEGGGWCDF